jgi:hypothetical protein
VVAFTLSGASSGQRWPSQGVTQAHHTLEHSNGRERNAFLFLEEMMNKVFDMSDVNNFGQDLTGKPIKVVSEIIA